MLEAVFACAVLIGGLALLARSPRSPTVIALLVLTAVEKGLTLAGVPFSPGLWIIADACAIAAIYTWRSSPLDWLVIALFGPEWASYFIDGQPGYALSVAACSAQFLLTFPWVRAGRYVRDRLPHLDLWRDFDLKVRHGP